MSDILENLGKVIVKTDGDLKKELIDIYSAIQGKTIVRVKYREREENFKEFPIEYKDIADKEYEVSSFNKHNNDNDTITSIQREAKILDKLPQSLLNKYKLGQNFYYKIVTTEIIEFK